MKGPLVVLGDSLLDVDVSGEVNRICPDSPAPVFEEGQAFRRPGGAALAATLLARAGHEVKLVTAIGDDDAGRLLRQLIEACGVELLALPYSGGTPEKIRMRAARQVLLRVDRSGPPEPVGAPEKRALCALEQAGAVLVSDYGRGVTSVNETRRVLAALTTARPVVWDPHPRSCGPVPQVRLVTPSESELLQGGRARGPDRFQQLAAKAAAARMTWRASAVTVTLGAQGAMLLDGADAPMVVAPPEATDGDACGAGDSFAGAATAALAGGALLSEAVQAAVAAASAFVAAGGATQAFVGASGPTETFTGAGGDAEAFVRKHVGSTREPAEVLAERVRAAGGRVVATGGCFDLLHTGHLATLRAARALGDCLIVCVNSDHSVRRLKGPSRPLMPQRDRSQMLEALECVDAVLVFDELTPVEALGRLRPDIWVKGGDYSGQAAPEMPEMDHIKRWGGQCVVVPYLAGRSTTRLIDSAIGSVSAPDGRKS